MYHRLTVYDIIHHHQDVKAFYSRYEHYIVILPECSSRPKAECG